MWWWRERHIREMGYPSESLIIIFLMANVFPSKLLEGFEVSIFWNLKMKGLN